MKTRTPPPRPRLHRPDGPAPCPECLSPRFVFTDPDTHEPEAVCPACPIPFVPADRRPIPFTLNPARS